MASMPIASQAAGAVKGQPMTVQSLLVGTLCVAGCTRYDGKAPRGKLAFKLRQKLRGVADDEDEEKMSEDE